MKYIRTKDGRIVCPKLIEQKYEKKGDTLGITEDESFWISSLYNPEHHKNGLKARIFKQADTIEELCDEIVLIENGNEHNIVYLQEAYDRIDEYHEQGNYEPRLIGRIKAGLDKKAVAEWKENEQGLYDWILL